MLTLLRRAACTTTSRAQTEATRVAVTAVMVPVVWSRAMSVVVVRSGSFASNGTQTMQTSGGGGGGSSGGGGSNPVSVQGKASSPFATQVVVDG
jgi:uncharacterized membrane protein YgcG